MKHITAIALAALVVLSALAGPVAAADDATGLNPDSDKTPNPTANVTWEKPTHQMGNGIDYYEDDAGNAQTLNGSLADVTNPITLEADSIAVANPDAFPGDGNSTLDPADYALTGNTTKLDVSNPGTEVPRITFETAGMATGDQVTATMDNVSITSDVTKRTFWVVGDVDELNGTAEVRLEDTDGDYVALTFDSAASTGDQSVAAGETTSSFVAQVQVSELAVQGTGDGTMGEIASTSFVANDGDVDISLSTIRADKLSKVRYGTHEADVDGDGSLELVDDFEPTGAYSVTSLETISSVFADATVHDLTFEWETSVYDEGQVQYDFNEEAAEEYDRPYIFEMFGSITLPNVEDLELVDAQIQDTVTYPTTRLVDAWYFEGAGDQTYTELGDSSGKISLVTDFEEAGDNATVTADDTISTGTRYVFYQAWTADEDDKTEMTADGSAGGLIGGGVSWLDKWVLNPIGGVIALFLGLFGLNKSSSSLAGS